MFDLSNKNIIVTGAAGLLGTSFCEAIIQNKGNPIAIDINGNRLKSLKKNLKKKFDKKIFTFLIDITNEKEIRKNSELLKNKFKKIDGLVNNAALNPKIRNKKSLKNNSLESFDLKKWNQELNVGLTGAFICSKYYGQLISINAQGGTIINISSDLGLIAPNQSLYKNISYKNEQDFKPITYSVIKFGIIGLTKYLSTYWSLNNVRSNAICPGGVELDQPNIFKKRIKTLIPLNRMAKIDEYKSTLIWMLSNNTEYLNGAVIPIDGGRSAW